MESSTSRHIIRLGFLVFLVTVASLLLKTKESYAYGESSYAYEVNNCWRAWDCNGVPKTPCCFQKCAFSACTKTSSWDGALTACSPQLHAYNTCMQNARPIQSEPMSQYSNSHIIVESATYGGNLQLPQGNVTGHIAGQCNNKVTCKYTVDHKVIGDPARGRGKDYTVRYRCSGKSGVFSKFLNREAGHGNKSVFLDCRK